MSLPDAAQRLDTAAAALDDAARVLADPGPPAAAFGAAAPGRLGDLGRALHGGWVATTGGRAREAAALSARLADAALALRTAAAGYAAADDRAARRGTEVA
jgi:hypothetical protein